MNIATTSISEGRSEPLGSTCDDDGVNFAVFSSVAEQVEVCLFGADGGERRVALPGRTGAIWHGHLAGVRAGQLYGLRVHGPWNPREGARCCAEKLLVDPYARAVDGRIEWHGAFFPAGEGDADAPLNREDTGPFAPKSVVTAAPPRLNGVERPRIPLEDTIIYELHVKGFTAMHPHIPAELRGTYAGLAHPVALKHLRHLGITAVELMPVQQFIHRPDLVKRGLRNYWGYDPIQYFALERSHARAATPQGALEEFREMVAALHGAGIEVILDVVFNHTGEGGDRGPVLCFKGIDNAAYYRLVEEDRRRYVNITGTDNTVNAGHPHVRRMVVDALHYWVGEMNVDGFRLDLAAVIGRHGPGLEFRAEFLDELRRDPLLADRKLIAEPWDLGHDGRQLGHFPPGWLEWNDRFRDDARDFWLRRTGTVSALAARAAGSPDVFDVGTRRPQASINYVTGHDGFTLRDLVSYEQTHNEANGEDNRDGMRVNRSWHCGVEGETEDAFIRALRERERRNLLTTLLVSQGIPMLLAGDELGHTQRGNNNAYCQDNGVSWLDWSDADRTLFEFVRSLCRLRTEHPSLRRACWLAGREPGEPGGVIRVFDAHANPIGPGEPAVERGAVEILVPGRIPSHPGGENCAGDADFLLLCNPREFDTLFSIPSGEVSTSWWKVVDTAQPARAGVAPRRVSGALTCRAHSMVVLMGCETR